MIKKLKYTHIPHFEERSFHFDHVKIYWNEQITFHEQKTWELSYIITGSGTRIIGDMIEPFSRNEIILIPPNIPHCWSFDELDADENGKIENITITFSDRFIEKCASTFSELDSYIKRIQQNTEAIAFGGNTLHELQYLLKAMTTQTEIDRLASLIKILALISSPENTNAVSKPIVEDKKTKRMQKILLYIMNNYQNPITLDEMAKLVDLDRSSFCIFFKKMVGKTFFSYLIEYRIEASCQMITKTNMTISEICYASGFKDVPYYNRIFKKIKNTTPTEYRNLQLAAAICP
ncbi:helix-turn-helix domain-containing protein [Dysgonomonas sp. Marseille-P4677]|uniref:AraC family transcriptional regulator n=1 Tax=Dysgonomonas sp. Marseille-P4677 TaxID=2364790 RepID=UPI00191344BA|nr:AraC family transcriptional regulator [Dysgonomonas sp. Marseille-P4677]MBK5722965.1 helix-turn-helix domain-containing protein [Dysgonomonas sp. Marseille-P4677]